MVDFYGFHVGKYTAFVPWICHVISDGKGLIEGFSVILGPTTPSPSHTQIVGGQIALNDDTLSIQG